MSSDNTSRGKSHKQLMQAVGHYRLTSQNGKNRTLSVPSECIRTNLDNIGKLL